MVECCLCPFRVCVCACASHSSPIHCIAPFFTCQISQAAYNDTFNLQQIYVGMITEVRFSPLHAIFALNNNIRCGISLVCRLRFTYFLPDFFSSFSFCPEMLAFCLMTKKITIANNQYGIVVIVLF